MSAEQNDSKSKWVPAREACDLYNVTQQTLKNWGDRGIIGMRKLPSSRYQYLVPESNGELKENVIYARVSSAKQKSDLGRQVDFLKHRFPNHRVITDVGSGVNFKRPGLLSLLDACIAGLIGEVVVAHRDRLARIGYGLLEHIFQRGGAILTVVEDNACDGCPEELHEDVMAVLTHFTAKHNGKRSYASKVAKAENLSDD